MSEVHSVLLALGSNIERHTNMPAAIERLGHHAQLKLCAISPMYESLPIGDDITQPTYTNAAVSVETTLEPASLKAVLRQIEKEMGRVRTSDKFASRPIDIDIAFYGQQRFQLDGNQIPDPDILRYAHLALPLADIAPDWLHPDADATLRHIADHLHYNKAEIYRI